MFISDKVVDEVTLSPTAMRDERQRHAYIQGAINDLLERWDDLIKDQDLQPRFVIFTEGLAGQGNDQALHEW